ncbi:MAG: aminodeoxychorismate synthase component I, partial [Bacteroidales bacterium]
SVSTEELYYRSQARYKLWVKDQFVLFSPEIFVRINNGVIHSYPMKGTIDASLPNARNIILSDIKESAEHATIVDLIRNDLSQIAYPVWVERYRYVDELKTSNGSILQVSSEVCGAIDQIKGCLGDLLFALLPAGSITGAPKPSTCRIIREAETHERNFYTGVCGIFDGENVDSAVMIRFIEERDGQLFFKSGGGITTRSCANDEYNELIQKVYVSVR